MIIIRFKGGMGNQLFQYALYKRFESFNAEVKADISDYLENRDGRKFVLQDIGLKLEYAADEEIEKYRGKFNDIFQMAARKYGLKKKYYREKENLINKKIFDFNDMYLDGYWQNEYYFKETKNEIIKNISSALETKLCNNRMAEQLQRENSVSIHVRRGDYIKNDSIYTELSKSDYYERAISYVENRIGDASFYIFSDDIAWAKKYFNNDKYIYMESDKGASDYEDMILMSKCRHNIIANSSFSWWAAQLNTNGDKLVIAPQNWYKDRNALTPVCDSWMHII